MRFLGVDQSLRHTGLGVVDSSGTLVCSEAIITGKLREAERLNYIRERVETFVEQWGPFEKAAIEGPSLQSTHREFDLGEISGVLRVQMYVLDCDPIVIPPTQLKKFLTGFGNAAKEQMLYEVNKLFHINLKDDNQADALGLALVARAVCLRTGGTRPQLEVVHSLLNPPVFHHISRRNKSTENI